MDEGGRAGNKERPKVAPGGTGPRQGTFAGGENPAPKFMQMRENFQADQAQRKSMYHGIPFCPGATFRQGQLSRRLGHAWAMHGPCLGGAKALPGPRLSATWDQPGQKINIFFPTFPKAGGQA